MCTALQQLPFHPKMLYSVSICAELPLNLYNGKSPSTLCMLKQTRTVRAYVRGSAAPTFTHMFSPRGCRSEHGSTTSEKSSGATAYLPLPPSFLFSPHPSVWKVETHTTKKLSSHRENMYAPSPSGKFPKAPNRGSRVFIVLGIIAILVNLGVIINMFLEQPVYSEEEEIAKKAIAEASNIMIVDWTSVEAKFKQFSARDIVVESGKLYTLYRLRVMIVATEAEVATLPELLNSLATANYSNRCFPVDVEVHILGSPSKLPLFVWEHGRYNVYAHRLHGNADLSIPNVLTDVWQPQSCFELGMPLTATVVLSPYWLQWVMRVVQHYVTTSKDLHYHLKRSTLQAPLRSPLSESLSGIALSSPVVGTGTNAATTVLSPIPSTITVFTVDYWKALLARAETGVDVGDTATASWRLFLAAGMPVLGRDQPQFLYPPLAHGGLAFDTAGVTDATCCTVAKALSPTALDAMLRLPEAFELIPRTQGNEK